jgi:hypothetical protein
MKSPPTEPTEPEKMESVRQPPDWAAMTKDHWKRFQPQMYSELENAGLLGEAANEAAKNIQALIDARTKGATNQQVEPGLSAKKRTLVPEESEPRFGEAKADPKTSNFSPNLVELPVEANLSPAVLLALTRLGRHYYDCGMTEFPTWSNHMRPRIGDGVGIYINRVWQVVTATERLMANKAAVTIPANHGRSTFATSPHAVTINAKMLLANIVTELREIPGALWREDANPWEEIKEQAQGELSSAWPAYIETIKGVIDHEIRKLAPAELQALSCDLKVPAEDGLRLREMLLRRLIARARKEKVRYEPFDFEHFWYVVSGMAIYTQILKRTGKHTCWVQAYSGAAPFGEKGEIDIHQIDKMTDIHAMTAEEFETARSLTWPCQLK